MGLIGQKRTVGAQFQIPSKRTFQHANALAPKARTMREHNSAEARQSELS